MHVLLADADASLADSLARQLAQDHFAIQLAYCQEQVQRLVSSEAFDAVVLDLHLFEPTSLDLLRGIRATQPNLPVLATTTSNLPEDRVLALDAGADDCLAKPFTSAELAARLRAVLRRGPVFSPKAMLTVEDLALDRVSHTVERHGRSVDLSPREFALLEFLMRHAGQPVARSAIIEQVWKTTLHTTTNVVDVYINYLRRKVDSGHEHPLIRTIRGIGYQIGSNGRARSR
jgi:two-component system, OmpR family, copper resistance phosphate regulon response regulator CusR